MKNVWWIAHARGRFEVLEAPSSAGHGHAGAGASAIIVCSACRARWTGVNGCPLSRGGGIGRLGLVDGDCVERSNLHRQIIHKDTMDGRAKVESASKAVQDLNPGVTVETHCCNVNEGNVEELVRDYDLVVDGTDNLLVRYVLNDACVLLDKPLVSGSAVGFDGQATVYNYKGGPCMRCRIPQPPKSGQGACSDLGVLGPVPGLIGTMLAVEAMKILGDFGSTLSGRLYVYDAFACRTMTVKLGERKKECRVCGDSPTIRSLKDTQKFCEKYGLTPSCSSVPPKKLTRSSINLPCTPLPSLTHSLHSVTRARPRRRRHRRTSRC